MMLIFRSSRPKVVGLVALLVLQLFMAFWGKGIRFYRLWFRFKGRYRLLGKCHLRGRIFF